ncbi:MAG: RNA polymerase sigma factor [Roseiflexaceae bacterium]
MPNINQQPANMFQIDGVLPSEWPRLVRLCAHFTGDHDAAEDLAQETLIEAWRHQDRVYDWQGYSSWLSAIARNVSLRWIRQRGREGARLVTSLDDATDTSEHIEQLPAAHDDFTIELERAELADLLDQALALLPAESRRVLVEKYIDELPLGEIAGRLGLSTGAVAVRLHRGRLALQRVLTTDLREAAASYGMNAPINDGWQETRIWCPGCGRRRLNGRLVPSTGELALRCIDCTPMPDMHVAYAQLPELMHGIKGYKPALSRLMTWSDAYYRRGRVGRALRCLFCGHPTLLRDGQLSDEPKRIHLMLPLHATCAHCGETTSTAHAVIGLCMPEGQRFWKAHPKIHLRSTAEINAAGSSAIVSSFASLTDSARFDVVTTRDTVEVVSVHTYP